MTLNPSFEFDDDLNNVTSERFLALRAQVLRELRLKFGPGVVVTFTQFVEGSVIVA